MALTRAIVDNTLLLAGRTEISGRAGQDDGVCGGHPIPQRGVCKARLYLLFIFRAAALLRSAVPTTTLFFQTPRGGDGLSA